jgi:hypothetical protein
LPQSTGFHPRFERNLIARVGIAGGLLTFFWRRKIWWMIPLAGALLILGVLLRYGLLAIIVTFYTFMAMEALPLTTNLARPYATSSVLLMVAIVAVSAYGFYASRGDEPLFGRPILD